MIIETPSPIKRNSGDMTGICPSIPDRVPREFKRILLVDPPTALKRHHCPSLGLSCLRSALLKSGFQVDSINLIKSRDPFRDLESALGNIDAVGITSNVASAHYVRQLGSHIRAVSPSTPVIVGGPFATTAPEQLLPNHADWVVIGEGEQTLVELLRKSSPVDVHGAAFADPSNQSIVINPPRKPISNLDSLPFPVWLEPDTRTYYLNSGNRNPLAGIMTSRGCPYDCVNCTKKVFGYKFRTRSAENVLQEVLYLKNRYHIRECFIWDDAFNIDIPRAKRILSGLAELDTGIRFAFPNAFRADYADEEFFRLMKAAGV
jgi:anaerobic magnesium-protoporphyrin IX monomethyl ester cyclase